MYSPRCTAHQCIVSETLKHSVILWSGSILVGLEGMALHRERARAPCIPRDGFCTHGLLLWDGWCCYPQLSPHLVTGKQKKTSRICWICGICWICFTFSLLLLGARGINWSRGGGWHWDFWGSQSACTLLELSWKSLLHGQMSKFPEQINPISSCNEKPRRWSQVWVGLPCWVQGG